ncbi:phosphorylase [Flavobacteriaceae bacterium AU392]|nr:phosphorylase [Flavobacteriaceae bacterium]RKM85660.1 phosphorylase [Flavobacteriaceae bacterium AU392]
MSLKASELILNSDNSIYHLNLRPEHIANTIITVGDPDRVSQVISFFDTVEFVIQKREFHTQTGIYKGKRLTVISTGIGTDNIDIVLNELDALVNIDFSTRRVKDNLTSLEIIRIGTSGSIQENIPINSFLISELAVGFDNLLQFYNSDHIQEKSISEAILTHMRWHDSKLNPYVIFANDTLLKKFDSPMIIKGFTATNSGFYGPQGRVLRLPLKDEDLNHKLTNFKFKNNVITNLEMETAGIYGLAKLLGHKAISINAILANRATGEFSKNPEIIVSNLIKYTLNTLVS